MSEKSQRPNKIAKYEIKRRIGRGSMGVVYEAYDPFVQRTVAIKVAHTPMDMDAAAVQKMRELFFAEVYSAGRMHHPSVVSVYDAGQEDDLNYIVMEFVDGTTLQEYVTGGRTLNPKQIVDVIYQCAKGLDYVHREGIIHRDLKPGNIMLSNEGDVKIMDFSIAHVDVGFEGHDTEVQGSPISGARYEKSEPHECPTITVRSPSTANGGIDWPLTTTTVETGGFPRVSQ